MGEALITCLNEKGIPTPLAATMLCAPKSRMDILTENEIDTLVSNSKITAKYNKDIDSESAYEILNAKLQEAAEKNIEVTNEEKEIQVSSGKKEKSTLEKILSSPVTRQVGRTAAQLITRSLLGALGLGGKSKSSTKSFF